MATINSLLWALPLLPIAMAQQQTPSTTPSETLSPTSSTQSATFSVYNGEPSHTDNAGQQDNNRNTVGLVNYYFVFIALIILAAFLAAFIMYRRKRRYGAIISSGRETALERDLNTWDPARARRRYWQGRWRSVETVSREEGLNEEGEAPPPYVPKSRDEESGPQTDASMLAVPMQTLSREQAGLKPPDYSELNTHAAGIGTGHEERTRHGAESAAAGEQQPDNGSRAQST